MENFGGFSVVVFACAAGGGSRVGLAITAVGVVLVMTTAIVMDHQINTLQ